jgi:uncharacterized membrane protein
MKSMNLFRDFMVGGLIVSFFSYITSLYEGKPYLLKLFSYLWGAPLIFFYLLHIVWEGGDKAVRGFLIHAVMGVSITIMSMIITLFIYKMGKETVVFINLMLLLASIALYLYYKIYLWY